MSDLKNAPSIFQKTIMQIFQPLLTNALVYIDNVLLFSPDEITHCHLHKHFFQIVTEYGIMLSEKKMVIAQTEIKFLGMKISNGKFHLQPHISNDLLKFPDTLTSVKQIQQFLGLVNYMVQFIHKVSKFTFSLAELLKNAHHPWSKIHTDCVKALKGLTYNLPPLHILLTGTHILQTDASNEYWAAILFKEVDNKRNVCGYKNCKFKPVKMHYHSTFKEVIAVKR